MPDSGSIFDHYLPVSLRGWLVGAGLLVHVLFNVIAALAFRRAALSTTWPTFFGWQILGNLAGFLTVLALTSLLRFIPLSVAYPVTTGLSVIGVQVVAASLLLHEALTPRIWLGTLFIVIGILLVGGRL